MKNNICLYSLYFLISITLSIQLSDTELSLMENIVLQDGTNNLDLTPETTVILTYTPHISMTYIKFPFILSAPYCIESFSSLSQIQAKDICHESATIENFQVSLNDTSPIYFRISTTSNTTLEIIVTTPVVNMSPSAPFAYISCQDNCYTLIHINCTERSCSILAGGDGDISTLDSDVGENKINLDRSGVYTIKARLENGGNLWIEMTDVNVVVIGKEKTKVEVAFGVEVIVPINEVSHLNSLLINSLSTPFFVSAQCYSLNISDSIFTKYDYPSPSSTKLLETNSKMSSVTKIDFNNLNVINKNCQQSGVKCFLTVGIFKTEEMTLPFVTSTDDLYLSTNSQIHELELNSPSYFTSYFSEERFMVLSSSIENYEIVPEKVSLKLLSACGNINQEITQMRDTLSNNIVPYFNTITAAACAYVTTLGLCKLPQIIAGIPEQIIVPGEKLHHRSTIITNESELHISVWGESGNKAIKINLYLIESEEDCVNEAKSGQLVDSGSFTYDQNKEIYSNAGEQVLKMIIPTKAQGKLLMFIIEPSDNADVDLWIYVNEENTIPVLMPNSASIPLQTHHETYSYYSNQMNWTICANSLSNFQFDVTVSFQSKHIANGSINPQKNCFSILDSVEFNIEAQEPNIQKYSITFATTLGKTAEIWVNIAEKPQFIEINDDTITYQPGNLAQSNGILGKCYLIETDEKTDFLLYFAESQKYSAMVQSSSKSTNVSQISKTGYRIAVQPNPKENKYIELCVTREETRGKDDGVDEGYYLGVEIESMNYNLISNDELVSGVTFLNSIGPISFSTLQAYRYINMQLPKSQYSEYLITELIQCQSSTSALTLLASSEKEDISEGSIATFSEFYTNHFFSVGLSELPESGEYFLGIKSDSDHINYMLRTTVTSSNQLEHLSWIFNSTIEKAQSTDGKYLIIQLAQPKSKNIEKLSDYELLFTITVIDKSETDYKLRESYAKCPEIFPVTDNITVVKEINPSQPIFKIEVEKLKSLNVSIFAKVEMKKNTGGSFNLYYEPSSIELEQTQDDEKENSKFSLGFVFLTITISIFLVLFIRFTIKAIRNRSSSNTVEFELSEQNRPFDSQRETNSNNNSSQNADERRPSNKEKREYQDFVDEEIQI